MNPPEAHLEPVLRLLLALGVPATTKELVALTRPWSSSPVPEALRADAGTALAVLWPGEQPNIAVRLGRALGRIEGELVTLDGRHVRLTATRFGCGHVARWSVAAVEEEVGRA